MSQYFLNPMYSKSVVKDELDLEINGTKSNLSKQVPEKKLLELTH